jgi:hypothetical protein
MPRAIKARSPCWMPLAKRARANLTDPRMFALLRSSSRSFGTSNALGPFSRGFHVLRRLSSSDTSPAFVDMKAVNIIRRLRRQQATLAEFGGFALGKVLPEVARVCAEDLDVPFSKVCRYLPGENDLLVEAGVGWHPGVIGCVASRADDTSPQGRVFITAEPVICGDLTNDPSFIPLSFYSEYGTILTLDVIIKKEGQLRGVGNRQPGPA